MPPMSIREYSRTRGASAKAIRRAVADGRIQRDPDGHIDELQADRAWASARRASRLGQHQHDDAGTQSAKAKIALTAAKLRLIQQRLDAMRERFVSREEAVRVGEFEATYVMQSLQAAPAIYAPILAEEMGIAQEAAERILKHFVGLALTEIGDLPQQARRAAERA